MQNSRLKFLVLGSIVAAIFAAGFYGAYRVGKHTGVRLEMVATAARQASPPSAVVFQAALETVRSYISSPEETTDAIATLQKHGGLVLPQSFYMIDGTTTAWYLRTIVPAYDPEVFKYRIGGTCDFVSLERRRIVLSPRDVGGTLCTVSVAVDTIDNRELTTSSVEVQVVPFGAGADRSFQMLMVGDSLGHQSRFPNELALLFSQPENPKVEFIGTHRPAGSSIPHEQYGGWRFVSFSTTIDVDPKYYHVARSPFVFKDPAGTPQFDVGRYLKESVNSASPRNVHIQLGINDAFALDPEGADLQDKLSEILQHADMLVSGIRKALPEAVITVGSVIQANATDRAFIDSYRPYPQFHSEWRWRQVQMKLARSMIDHFGARQSERVLLVPTHMTVDPLDGYTAHVWVPDGVDYDLSNAVHPAQIGDRQLAATIYAVVKAELAGLPGTR